MDDTSNSVRTRVEVIPCICCGDRDPNGPMYYGMPQLKITHNMKWYEIYCPKCGRGGLLQFTSPYKAVQDWNDMQWRLRKVGKWEIE
jgi:hypothetical protein